MKTIVSLALALMLPALSHALTPRNHCGKGSKIVMSYGCADAQTGGSYSLGAFAICSKKEDGQTVGFTSLLDDNVVAYGGGIAKGAVTLTATTLTISYGKEEADVLDLKTGLAVLQNTDMKCTLNK